MLYCELEKHTFPRRGDRTRFSSVEYMLRGDSFGDKGKKNNINQCYEPRRTFTFISHTKQQQVKGRQFTLPGSLESGR